MQKSEPESARPAPARNGSFVVRHWRGAYSLGASFWLVGIVGTLVLHQVWAAFSTCVARTIESFGLLVACAFALIAVQIVVWLWQWIGIWRAARPADSSGTKAWRITTRVASALLALIVAMFIVINIGVAIQQAGDEQHLWFPRFPPWEALCVRP